MEQNDFQEFLIDDAKYKTKITKKFLRRKPYKPREKNVIKSFIPGTIREVYVKEGDIINEGDKLLVLEAMKMRNTITSHLDGKIKKIAVKTGDVIPKEKELIIFEI